MKKKRLRVADETRSEQIACLKIISPLLPFLLLPFLALALAHFRYIVRLSLFFVIVAKMVSKTDTTERRSEREGDRDDRQLI